MLPARSICPEWALANARSLAFRSVLALATCSSTQNWTFAGRSPDFSRTPARTA